MRNALMIVALSCSFAFRCGPSEAPSETAAPPAAAATPALPLPTADQAKEIIGTAPEFSDFQSPYSAWSLPLQESMMNEPARKGAADLEAAGWIRLRGGEVELVEKAKSDRRWLMRQNGFVEIVPLAKKELLSVTSVSALPDGNMAAEFDWKWIPNEIGAAFRSGPVKERFDASHRGKATLQPRDGGGWEVLILESIDR